MPQQRERRLFMLFHGRFPSEKAAAVGLVKKAESFAEVGLQVTILTPEYHLNEDPFVFFGVKKNFSVVRLPVITLVRAKIFQKVAYNISSFFFSLSCLAYLLRHTNRRDAIFSNEPLALLVVSFFYSKCFFEVHLLPAKGRWFFGVLLRRTSGIITINRWLSTEIIRVFSISPEKVYVAPSGVDLERFSALPDTEAARKQLNLPVRQKILVYTGQLYTWKGVGTLVQAAKQLPDISVILVGGAPDHVARFLDKHGRIPNVLCVGQVAHTEVPLWQAAADALALPNSARQEISVHYTSPIKLFEYMASNRPIIAARLPSLAEVLDNTLAFFFEPDNSESLAGVIREVFTDLPAAQVKAAAARQRVEAFTWKKRATSIVEYFHL